MYSVRENSSSISLTVVLSNPSSTNFTVHVFSSNDSAIGKYMIMYLYVDCHMSTIYDNTLGNVDYTSGPYMATVPAGMTNASFNVGIIDNDELENTENFYLTIDSSLLPNNVMSHPSQAIVTILDDDCKLYIIYVLLWVDLGKNLEVSIKVAQLKCSTWITAKTASQSTNIQRDKSHIWGAQRHCKHI